MNYPSPGTGVDSCVSLIILWDSELALAKRTIATIANFAIFGNRIEQQTVNRSSAGSLSLFIRTYISTRTSASSRDGIM